MSDRWFDLLTGAGAIAALALGCALWLAATRPLRRGGIYDRALDGLLALCWVGVVFFYLLAGLGVFHVWAAASVLIATGAVAAVLSLRLSAPPRDPPEHALGHPPGNVLLLTALPVCAIAVIRLVKGMIAPPMAWDAMTMHLPKAAFWIQSGSLALPDFPDAWTYYRWFPGGGEILFAWVMLPVRGDLLLGAFGFVVWTAIWVAAARLTRRLGAPDLEAWLAGGAIASLPAVLAFMTANYVENLVVLFVLLAISHAISFAEDNHPRHAVLGLAAAGLAVSVKTSSLVLAAPPVLAMAIAAWRHRSRESRNRDDHRGGASTRARIALAAAVAAAVALPGTGYLWTWIRTGSPFYPLQAPGLSLPHHEGLADLFSGRVFAPAVLTDPGWQAVARLFRSGSGEAHLNFGAGGAILAAAGLVGFLFALRRPGRRPALLLCLAGAVLLIPLVLSPANLALRTVWIGVLGRHLLAALAPIALCAALLPRWIGRAALGSSLLASTLHFFPIGWSDQMTAPALRLAAVVVVCALSLGLLDKLTVTFLGARRRWGLAVVGTFALLVCWTSLRDPARYPIYRETAPSLGAFDAHPIHPTFAMAASLWPILDSREPKTIATTIGPDEVGHNQFFYPLLGSRLQNRLVHIPTSNHPQELMLSAGERYARADRTIWFANLEDASIDLVVGLWQPTPERDWLVEEGSFEVTALTDLGVPWIARRRAP